MRKTTKNNDQNDQISTIFGIFTQIKEKNSLKSKLMYIIWFSSFEKHIKELILTTLDKKIEENPQK